MQIFNNWFKALKNKDYYKSLENQIENLIGNSGKITVKDLKNKSIFSDLDRTMNSSGKTVFENIAGLDGDETSLSKLELMVLLLCLDGEQVAENDFAFDGIIDINENNKINTTTILQTKMMYNLIKNHDDIANNKNTELSVSKNLDNTLQIQGNCWFLSEINGFNNTSFGKKIITNAITKNGDGSYTIEFKGDNKSYTFTKQDILKAKGDLSHVVGNDTVLLLEIAFERLFAEMDAEEVTEYLTEESAEQIINSDKDGNYTVELGVPIELSAAELKEVNTKEKKEIIKAAIIKKNLANGMHGSSGFTDEFDILFHLTGQKYIYDLNLTQEDNVKDAGIIEKALIMQAKNKNSMMTFFNSSYIILPEHTKEIVLGHAYCINDVVLNSRGKIEKVGIVNPYDSSQTIYKTFDELLKISLSHGLGADENGKYEYFYDYAFGTDLVEIKKALADSDEYSEQN